MKKKVIKQFNKYVAFLCSIKEAYRFSIVYVAIVEFIKAYNIEITMDYLRVVIMSVEVIFFYFIIKDSLSFVMKYIIIRNKSKASDLKDERVEVLDFNEYKANKSDKEEKERALAKC